MKKAILVMKKSIVTLVLMIALSEVMCHRDRHRGEDYALDAGMYADITRQGPSKPGAPNAAYWTSIAKPSPLNKHFTVEEESHHDVDAYDAINLTYRLVSGPYTGRLVDDIFDDADAGRLNDVWFSAFNKIYHNLYDFHVKVFRIDDWTAQPELKKSNTLMRLANQPCTDRTTGTNYLRARSTGKEVLLLNDTTLALACMEKGAVPIFRCTGGRCECISKSVYTKWMPYLYIPSPPLPEWRTSPNATCKGDASTLCEGEDPGYCPDTYPCQDGFCGGRLTYVGAGVGGVTTFREEEIREVLVKQKLSSVDQATEYLIRTSNSKGRIGHNCDVDFWEWATQWHMLMIDQFNNVSFYHGISPDTEFFTEAIWGLQDTMEQYLDTSSFDRAIPKLWEPEYFNDAADKDIKIRIFKKMAELYEDAEGCIDEFPRMRCNKLANDPTRGRCQCMTTIDSKSPFNYVQENGFCVGGVGTVCTTVRGSGDHICQKGLVCTEVKPVQPPGLPSPLTHTVIKTCELRPRRKPKPGGSEKPSRGILKASPTVAIQIFTIFLNLIHGFIL